MTGKAQIKQIASHLQNVIPALLVEDVVLKVFSVHVLGFLDLLGGDDFSCGGGGGKPGHRDEMQILRKKV